MEYKENNNELNHSLNQDEEEMSFTDKVAALFSEPSNLFESIKNYPPRKIDWLVPTLIVIIVIIFSTIMQMRDVEIKNEIKQKQIEQLQKLVDEGRISPESLEQSIAGMEKVSGSGYQLFFTLVGVPIGVFFMLFITALIYWVIAKLILKGDVMYGYVLSLVGLINIIGIFSTIVTLVLSILYGKMNTGLNLALLASAETSMPVLKILNAIDPFTIWSLILMSIGLAKFCSVPFTKSAIAVFGFAVIFLIISILAANLSPSIFGM